MYHALRDMSLCIEQFIACIIFSQREKEKKKGGFSITHIYMIPLLMSFDCSVNPFSWEAEVHDHDDTFEALDQQML